MYLDGSTYTTTDNTTTTVIVNGKNTPNMSKLDTNVQVDSSFTFTASDYNAGEKCGVLKFSLKGINGSSLANKTVQVALDCIVYNVTTDESGFGQLEIDLAKANDYTCAISFKGDETYNASPLAITKVTIDKKKTTLTASAKKFKANAKKTISVTLKTVKNQYMGKTYLSKGKKLTLKVNGKAYTAKTNAKGIAKFSIKLTKKGKYTAKIKFAGDDTYKSSGKSIKITIK